MRVTVFDVLTVLLILAVLGIFGVCAWGGYVTHGGRCLAYEECL